MVLFEAFAGIFLILGIQTRWAGLASVPVLVGHDLCSYAERAAISLTEKCVEFARREIDLANNRIGPSSPIGKTPMPIGGEEPVLGRNVVVGLYTTEIRRQACMPIGS